MGTQFVEGKRYVLIIEHSGISKVSTAICTRRHVEKRSIPVSGANPVTVYVPMIDIQMGNWFFTNNEVKLSPDGDEITTGAMSMNSNIGDMSKGIK